MGDKNALPKWSSPTFHYVCVVSCGQVEKKVEGIRNSVMATTKKLSMTIVGSGVTMDKHQVQYCTYHK